MFNQNKKKNDLNLIINIQIIMNLILNVLKYKKLKLLKEMQKDLQIFLYLNVEFQFDFQVK